MRIIYPLRFAQLHYVPVLERDKNHARTTKARRSTLTTPSSSWYRYQDLASRQHSHASPVAKLTQQTFSWQVPGGLSY